MRLLQECQMLARNCVQFHASTSKSPPTKVFITNPVERLPSHSEDRNTSVVFFRHKIRAGKVNAPRVLAICRSVSRENGWWSITTSPVSGLTFQETELLPKCSTQKQAQPARIVLNVHY